MAAQDMEYLFKPRGVAVVGASHNTDKIGYKVLENIIKGGYKGDIYPINPKGGEILGKKVYTSVADCPGPIDIADICVPAKFVFDAVKECTDAGVKFLPIITSGFSEIGNHTEEKKIVDYATSNGSRVIGPNIFGVFSAESSLNATFGPDEIQHGHVAIITQSGALGLSMIGKTAVENIGLSAIVSVGNKADVTEVELLEYLMEQEQTQKILIYIEGVRKGKNLVKALKKASAKKPVIVIKSGRSKRGALAVASHTGSLAGSDQLFDDIMRQCGALRAESIAEAFDWCKFLGRVPMPKDTKTAIITNGGGIGVMAADACEKYGVPLYDNQEDLKKTFEPATPSFGSTKNPVDITGGATSKEYNEALEAALNNPNIDSVISLYCETAVFDYENLAPMIEENYNKYREAGKPLLFCIFGGERIENAIVELRHKRIPAFDDVYKGVSCMGALYSYENYVSELSEEEDAIADIDTHAICEIASRAIVDGRKALLADEGAKLMEITGIKMPSSAIAKNADDAVKKASEIGFPVVMKVISKDILHKSDSGGVILGIRDENATKTAYNTIIENCTKAVPNAAIEGVEISEMARQGAELILGARQDEKFGPTLMCGLGGIYVELLKDVSFRATPLSREEILRMIRETKAYKLLEGMRGESPRDIDSVVDALVKLSTIVCKCPSITDIEINPVRVYEKGEGLRALDVRVLVK